MINPLNDLAWAEYLHAIEAAAMLAAFNFRTMTRTLLMSDAQRVIFRKVQNASHAAARLTYSNQGRSTPTLVHPASSSQRQIIVLLRRYLDMLVTQHR
jgi:hypothetical protein